MKKDSTVISLFSGCGGMDLGFSMAGCEILWAADVDRQACDTYYYNLGGSIHCLDIRHIDPFTLPDTEILICGPPCQGFSNIGKMDPSDSRNLLYLDVLRIVRSKKPSYIVFENVKGFNSFNLGKIVEELIISLKDIGYHVEWKILNAKNFGLAQNRERIFIIANNSGFENIFEAILQHEKDEIPILEDFIGDLEGLYTLSNHYCNTNISERNRIIISKISQGQKLCDTRLGNRSVHTWQIPEVFGHTSESEQNVLYAIARNRRKKRFRKMESWHDASPLTIEEMRTIIGKEFKNSILQSLIEKGYIIEKIPGFFDLKHTFNGKFRRLDYNRQSEAILTNFGSPRNYVHPTQPRPLTIRECARIQGFPDNFIFRGSLNSQYKLVGNAVPPALARIIAEEIRAVSLNRSSCIELSNQNKFSPFLINYIIEFFKRYNTPNLGNYSNPLDELIYLYISQRTFEKSYRAVFNKLKKQYKSYDKLRKAGIKDIKEILMPSGLASQKAKAIKGALLKIYVDFGETSLRKLKSMDDEERLKYLLTLPRVGIKTAYCLLLFSFDSKVLPVDANIQRVCQRFGLLPDNVTSEKAHKIMNSLIPLEERYSFHVNCIMHARQLCLPIKPKCVECGLKSFFLCIGIEAQSRKRNG